MANYKVSEISKLYFRYMAENFPVMSLSDEFYFFPRAQEAVNYLNVLDGLDREKIKENLAYIKGLEAILEKADSGDMGLEERIDFTILHQSMASFLREFGRFKVWQKDPVIYLKIIILGIGQVRSRFLFAKKAAGALIAERSLQIPRLLREARENLKEIPVGSKEVALEIIGLLAEDIPNLPGRALDSLAGFKRSLKRLPSTAPFTRPRGFIEDILKKSFSYNRPLEEIFIIARDEYKDACGSMEKIAGRLRQKRPWRDIIASYETVNRPGGEARFELYSKQIDKIKAFLEKREIISIPKTQRVIVGPTPASLRPVRASASYAAPWTNDPREPARFYIAYDSPDGAIDSEYIYVTAHETYPGHHLLDGVRRRLKNPIRRQLESPLFYEGWASYAEELLDELGYIKEPLQKLIGLRRRAWRAVRAMLDVGVRIGRLKAGDAKRLLKGLGYSDKTAESMFRHYLQLPGYQLCYTIGKFEIERLRKTFSPKLGLKKFHDLLLEGGQIPFGLAEERLRKELCRKNS